MRRHETKRGARRTGGAFACMAFIVACACLAGLAFAGCTPAGEQEPGSYEDPTAIVDTQATQNGSAATEATEADGQADERSDGQETVAETEEVAEEAEEDDEEDLPLSGYTVCIDAGHGDTVSTESYPNSPYSSETGIVQPVGTTGSLSGAEYEVNLEVALKLQKMLEKQGATVVMVRTSNDVIISPKERAEVANDCDADVFLRLHCDSAGSSANGFLTLIPAESGYQADDGLYKVSQKMGTAMHEQIVEELGANDRGTSVRSDQGGFNWCKVPCVLFEMANMANADDDALLATASYKKKLARAICNATVSYLAGD